MKCEIVRDLLPSYVDELTSVESNEEIEKHLEQCEECREYLDEMRKEISGGNKKVDSDIQFLLRIKKATARKVLIAVILTAIISAISIEYYKAYYYHGKSMTSDEVIISYTEEQNFKALCFEPLDEDIVVYVGYTENEPVNGKMPLETISLLKYNKNPMLNSPNENHYTMRFMDDNTVLCLYSYPEEVDFDEDDFIAIKFGDEVKTIKMSDIRDGNIDGLK